jgi:hypothetical protein
MTNWSNRGLDSPNNVQRFERAFLIGTQSANFIKASGHQSAAPKGRTYVCT